MGSSSSLPSCLQLPVPFLPLVSTNPGLPTQVLFARHPPHTTLEEQMCVGRVMEMRPCSFAIPAASTWQRPKENKTNRRSFFMAYAGGSGSVSMSAGCSLQSRICCPHRKIHRPFSPPWIRRLNLGLTTFSLRSNWQVLEKVLDCHNPVVRWQMFAELGLGRQMGWPLFFRLVPGHRIGSKILFWNSK